MATKYIRAAGGNWNADATWSLSSGGAADTTVPTSADDAVADSNSGANAITANITVKSFVQTGTPGITTNNGFILYSGGDITLLAGKYVAANESAILSFLTVAAILTTGGNPIGGLVTQSNSAVATLGDNLSFIAGKSCVLSVRANNLNLNGKTISGNSATNRLLIYSNTIGTSRTVTVNGGTFANCAFRDIAFANGGADLDLSAITGLSSDCGGNSMSGGGVLTFTTARTCTFKTTSGNWSDAASWTTTGATDRVPLAQDLARTQAMSASQTITVDMPLLPDTSFAGCGSTNLPSVALTTAGLTYEIYGSLNLTGVAAGGWSCTKYLSLMSRSNASLTSNGQAFAAGGRIYVYMQGATLTLNDALLSSDGLFIINGTVSSDYNVTVSLISITSTATALNLGSGVWTVTSSWGVNAANATINAGTATIALTYTGATACTFAGGINTYNDITIAPGSGVLTFSGAFTFRNMTMSSAGTRSIVFTKATNYTHTGTSFLSGAGVDDAPIITPSLLNGGFETAGAGGADVFANWVESVAGTSTVTDDTVTPYSGGHACKLQCDALGNIARIYQTPMTSGRIYKIEFYAKSDNGATLQVFQSTDTSLIHYVPIAADWAKYTVYGAQPGNATLQFRINTASKNVYIDDITVTPLNSVLIQSSGAGEAFTLSKASGLVTSNFLALKDSIATGGAIWLAGYNSTNTSGNTGWKFNSPATGAGVIEFVGTATAKALCRGIPAAAEIVFNATATAKALCRAAGSGVIEFVGACSAIVAAWKTTGLFKATERTIGQYFKASKRRN